MTTRVVCVCDARGEAMKDATLIYWPHAKAWVLTEVKPRRMSGAARYFAFAERQQYAHADHSGEPYTFTLCPFCGHELPGTEPVATSADATGYGEGAE